MDEAARQPFKDVETKETERFDAEMLAYNEPVRPHPFPDPLRVVEPSLGLNGLSAEPGGGASQARFCCSTSRSCTTAAHLGPLHIAGVCAQDAKAAREEAARTAVLAGEEKRAKLTAP